MPHRPTSRTCSPGAGDDGRPAGGPGGAQGAARRGQRRRRHGQGRDDRRPALESLTIDPDAVDPEDVEMLQDMVVAAVNEALRAGRGAPAEQLGGAGPGRLRPDERARVRSGWAAWAASAAAAAARAACRAAPRRTAPRAARARSGSACSPRPSSASSPSSASCRASATAPRSGSPSTCCAPRAEDADALAEAIRDVKEKITLCEVCFNLAEGPRCTICLDERRDPALICVVEEPGDVIPIERTHEFRGRYHVLGGALSPIDGVEPEDLRLAQLYARVARRRSALREVVLATNPTTTGEATALHVAGGLHERAPEVAVTRLASGPAGRRRPRVRRRGHPRPGLRRPPRDGLKRSPGGPDRGLQPGAGPVESHWGAHAHRRPGPSTSASLRSRRASRCTPRTSSAGFFGGADGFIDAGCTR